MAEERAITTATEGAGAGWRSGSGCLITRREFALVLLWAVLIVGLTALPYLWAVSLTGDGATWEGHQFQGFMWGVDEGNVYRTWIRQASEGELLLRNQYTTHPQNPSFFNVFMLASGKLVAWTGESAGVIFHVMRLAGGVALLLSIYLLAACLTTDRTVRWACLALASLGSGFGWLAGMWVNSLPDYMPPPLRTPDYAPPGPPAAHTWQAMPEAITFVSMLLNPLFIWSMALLCVFFVTALLAMERRNIAWGFLAGVILLVLGNVHTYDVFVAHGALILFIFLLLAGKRISWKRALVTYGVILVVSLASPIWAWYTAQSDPAYLAKINTKTLSPRPIDYAAGYGLPLLLALGGIVWVWRNRFREYKLLFPVCWLLANAVLVYAPVAFQRKMAEGMHIPICVLAGVGLIMAIAPRLTAADGKSRAGILIFLAVALSLPSNALFVADIMQHTGANNIDLITWLQPPAYLPWDEVRAIEYLGEHADADDVVFSSSLIGSHIPPGMPGKVFAGHWAETLDFSEKVYDVGSFYLPGRSPAARKGLLRRAGADWVYYGYYEGLMARMMMLSAALPEPDDAAAIFRESTEEILEPVYESDTVTIYRVRPDTVLAWPADAGAGLDPTDQVTPPVAAP